MAGTLFIARQYEKIQYDATFLICQLEKKFADRQAT